MEVLKDLLRIKIFREQKAERQLAIVRQHLKSVELLVMTARKALKEFRIEIAHREKELFADLCTRLVVIREIDSVRIDIQLMKEHEDQLADELVKAESRRDEAVERERESRLEHANAVRMREKFDELVQLVTEEHDNEIAMREEIDIEESAESRFLLAGPVESDKYTSAEIEK